MTAPTIVVFAGSAREDSFNKKLARQAALFAEQAGAKAEFIDLRDIPMPLFDQDLEERDGEHPNATTFKAALKKADGIIIASPEHNSTYSALLKNVIDWASRKRDGEKPLECFSGKTAAIMSASPGGLGGLRGLTNLRALLASIGMIVMPNQIAISQAFDAFNEDGTIKDEAKAASVRAVTEALVSAAGKLKA